MDTPALVWTRITRAGLLAVGLVAALCPAAPGQAPAEEPAAAVARQFLTHLETNQPIAGEFQIVTDIDAGQQRALMGAIAPAPKPGIITVPEPARQVLNSRWAWATGREVAEALPGSAGSMYGFLTLPEGTLSGINDHQFNLTKSEMPRADFNRPALFYFLDGGDHWTKHFAGATFSLEAPADPRPGLAWLGVQKGQRKAVLAVERATGHLREAAVSHNGNLSWKLVVDELAISPTDGRAFPRKARVQVYGMASPADKPFRTVRLTATRVDFPTAAAVAKEFRLPVRAGAIIGDRVRDMAILPDAPTDGADIITKDMPRVAYTDRAAPPAPAEGGFVDLFPADGVPKGWVVTEWSELSKPAPAGVQWQVKDGVLSAGKQRGTWLISEKEYADFVLEFEVKLTEKGNSGVAVRTPLKGDPAFDAMEVQLADVRYNPEATPAELTGGIYRAVAPTRQVYKPTEWNTCRLELRGDKLKLTLNGEVVQDVDVSTFDQPVKRHDGTDAKPIKDRPRAGRIGFQHLSRNNEPVFIRKARIRELKPAAAPPAPDGVRPVGADGKPLNLDFETGTLQDWTADGPAFARQPIKGDLVAARRADSASRHQGEYWIGGYETGGDKLVGTLTSVPFAVTHPWASFLVGGGPWPETCVEVVSYPRGDVIFRASGLEQEDLRRVAVDMAKHMGQQIRVRVVDRHTGHWGHVNFDDFRFHADKPVVPAAAPAPPAKRDVYQHAGLSPEKAAAAMTLPPGFAVTLFAGEPDIHQPVGFCIDDRGRLWVAEAYTYPQRHKTPGPVLPAADAAKGDRIVILEDTDGDGRFDKRTVFIEGLNLVSGIEVGFGGVYVGAAPYLLFIPDKDGDDKPDGPPQILLDGWGFDDTHEVLNTFTWGPDGWLYGCHGVFNHSKVGKPGTPAKDRVAIDCGIWRYHPTRHTFELFAEGTSNPWGLDYNDKGDFFIEACVIPHCFHVIQGGRYLRQVGPHQNPYTYADINTIADHLHWQGANPWAGNASSGDKGGGHAHCGLMCYQGGTWPAEYRNQLFMGNLHGRRLNVDVPAAKGSGYTASHGTDFLHANDEWARFINLRSGPDGNVYLIDWYDKQACHVKDPKAFDRTNGRVFKVSLRGSKAAPKLDLAKCTDAELVAYQTHDNDWYARHARRLLQERAAVGLPRTEGIQKALFATADAFKTMSSRDQLRMMWTWHVVDNPNQPAVQLADWLETETFPEHVRAWAVQLTLQLGPPDALFLASMARAAKADPSPVVRRYIASGLQRVPVESRREILAGLLSHSEDAADVNLPFLYWYALEPIAGRDPQAALDLALNGKVPLLVQLTARRIAATSDVAGNDRLATALTKADVASVALILRGMTEGFKGRRNVARPAGWAAAAERLAKFDSPDVKSLANSVAITFGDRAALGTLRALLADPSADIAARQAAAARLVAARDAGLPPLLHKLLADRNVRGAALRSLAAFDDAKTPAAVLAIWPSLSAAEKRDALATLSGRSAYAHALLDAVAAKAIPAADVPAEVVRQLRNLNDPTLAAKTLAVWGSVRETPADRKKLIAGWARTLAQPGPTAPDLSHGRAVFAKACQQCHTLYGVGGKVGPDITGSNRPDLAYLLENIFDPSAVIPKEYAATKLDLSDGRVVTGIVKEETKAALTVATANETLTIPAADIDRRTLSEQSMMPDDVTKPLTESDVRALIAYLQHPKQVPLLATADNAKDFFNGKDLIGWDADPALWTVEAGELVGRSAAGLKRNNFAKGPFAAADFKLSMKVKLTPNTENSGVQFRSEPLPDGEMRGPQADAGAGWWGKLYEESGRGLLWKESGEKHVRPGEWNEYVIEAVGPRVRTWINGKPCVDLTDPKLARTGLIGFQLHSGGPIEVRFKGIRLEVIGK